MNKFQAITRMMSIILFLNCRNIPWNFMQYLVVLCFMSVSMCYVQSVRLATECESLPPNDKISNHSVANLTDICRITNNYQYMQNLSYNIKFELWCITIFKYSKLLGWQLSNCGFCHCVVLTNPQSLSCQANTILCYTIHKYLVQFREERKRR